MTIGELGSRGGRGDPETPKWGGKKAKEIKHTYNLDDIESESDDEFFESKMEVKNNEEIFDEA